MGMPFAELLKKLIDLHGQIVRNSTLLDELRRNTERCLADFKHALEVCEERAQRIERERIEKEAQLLARIGGLEQRLDMLSERALHLAITETAKSVVSQYCEASARALHDGKSSGFQTSDDPPQLLDDGHKEAG